MVMNQQYLGIPGLKDLNCVCGGAQFIRSTSQKICRLYESRAKDKTTEFARAEIGALARISGKSLAPVLLAR